MNFVSSLASAALIVIGCASLCARAGAQEVGAGKMQPSADEQTLKRLKDAASKGSDGAGLVFVGAIIFQGSSRCFGIETSVGQVVDGKYHSIPVQSMYKVLGQPKHYGPKALKAGQYYIGWVKCQQFVGSPTGGTTFKGPHAKFQVRAGEVVDVGALKLQYENENIITGKGKTHLSVAPTDPERLAETRKQTPAVMSKLVTRHMVLVGSADREVKRPGF